MQTHRFYCNFFFCAVLFLLLLLHFTIRFRVCACTAAVVPEAFIPAINNDLTGLLLHMFRTLSFFLTVCSTAFEQHKINENTYKTATRWLFPLLSKHSSLLFDSIILPFNSIGCRLYVLLFLLLFLLMMMMMFLFEFCSFGMLSQ